MDARTARRAAEKAARALIGKRAALVGELAAAQAERSQSEADVTAATERGRELVAMAEAEAARLLEAAQALVRDAEQRYMEVYGATTAAGWAMADLTALGFQPRVSHGPRRRRPPATADTNSKRAATNSTVSAAASDECTAEVTHGAREVDSSRVSS